MNNNVSLFFDKSDLIFQLSNDGIINITGISGSGKSTLSTQLSKNKKYIYIKFDWLFGYGHDKNYISQGIKDIIVNLQEKYPEIKDKNFFRWNNNKKNNLLIEERYKIYTPIFYNYIINSINEYLLIDGIQLLKYINIKDLKGKIIVKRTSLIHCYIRAFKRDVYNSYKKYKSRKISFASLFNKFYERIKIPIKYYKIVNLYISQLLTIKNGEN